MASSKRVSLPKKDLVAKEESMENVFVVRDSSDEIAAAADPTLLVSVRAAYCSLKFGLTWIGNGSKGQEVEKVGPGHSSSVVQDLMVGHKNNVHNSIDVQELMAGHENDVQRTFVVQNSTIVRSNISNGLQFQGVMGGAEGFGLGAACKKIVHENRVDLSSDMFQHPEADICSVKGKNQIKGMFGAAGGPDLGSFHSHIGTHQIGSVADQPNTNQELSSDHLVEQADGYVKGIKQLNGMLVKSLVEVAKFRAVPECVKNEETFCNSKKEEPICKLICSDDHLHDNSKFSGTDTDFVSETIPEISRIQGSGATPVSDSISIDSRSQDSIGSWADLVDTEEKKAQLRAISKMVRQSCCCRDGMAGLECLKGEICKGYADAAEENARLLQKHVLMEVEAHPVYETPLKEQAMTSTTNISSTPNPLKNLKEYFKASSTNINRAMERKKKKNSGVATSPDSWADQMEEEARELKIISQLPSSQAIAYAKQELARIMSSPGTKEKT